MNKGKKVFLLIMKASIKAQLKNKKDFIFQMMIWFVFTFTPYIGLRILFQRFSLIETEALAPVDVMRRAKLDVKTVGVTGKCVTSSHGVPVKADITIDNIDFDDVQGVVLPGGMPGTLNLEANKKVLEAVKYSCENGKIVAAICAAPSILGHLGILDGKKATCFPGFEKELKGADYTGTHTVTDGNIITAKGAGCAIEFGHAIVSLAVSKDAADKVIGDMQCL